MIKSIFREYDIRGLVPEELSEDTVRGIGLAFGTLMRSKGLKTISVGGDVRLHTERVKDIFITAVNNTGIDVLDIGIVTSPLCYFSAFHLPIDGFAMITASHNPKEYNGLKLGVGKQTLFGEEITNIHRIAESGDFAQGEGKREVRDITKDYCDYIVSKFRLSRPIRLALDPANATGALFAREIFQRIGAEVVAINDTVDGNFPNHHPDPTVWENMISLSEKVKATGSEIGIGLDGDSDRIGVIDETGALIPGDLLTLILARDVLQDMPGAKIIYEVKSSMALEEEITKAGGIPIMWKVGHSLLKKKMMEEKAPLAGEVSGHIFFADKYFGYDDAIYAGCRMLSILDKTGKTPSGLLEGTPIYFNTPEIRLECDSDEDKFRIAKQAVEYFSSKYPVISIDGVRVLFEGGWGLVRASNTQPALVTRFEGKTEERCRQIQEEVLNKLKEFGNIRMGDKH